MKKYVFVKTGNPVEMGEVLVRRVSTGFGIVNEFTTITEDLLPELLLKGIIKEYKEDVVSPPENISYYTEHLANRLNWKTENLLKYLDTLSIINETAVFSILLREIAIVLDTQYPDHIERSKEIYCINLLNGGITKIKDLNKINNFKNFAAFRSIKDALFAKEILKEGSKNMFKRCNNGGKQKS